MSEPARAQSEFNICGVLVQARPQRVQALRRELGALPGVEVHLGTDDGRLVLTVEDTADRLAGDTLSCIHVIDGVLSAALVYHHCERGGEPAATAKEI